MSDERVDWAELGRTATRSAWQTLIIVAVFIVVMYLGAWANDHSPR